MKQAVRIPLHRPMYRLHMHSEFRVLFKYYHSAYQAMGTTIPCRKFPLYW